MDRCSEIDACCTSFEHGSPSTVVQIDDKIILYLWSIFLVETPYFETWLFKIQDSF
jgi:hypothetical protein